MNTAELGEENLVTEGLVNLFKVLSKPDALEVFLLAGEGIKNSAYAIEELGFSSKKYYARLRELVDIGFVTKTEGAYRQTPFGSIFCDRFLPAMGRAYDARDRLGLIAKFKGTLIEDEVRSLIEDELRIPDLAGSTNVEIIDNYESMVIDVIDLCDEADESVLMASNHCDVRVMEATFRSVDRGVTNKIIAGEEGFSSRLQQLRMILSPSFAKSLINFASNSVDIENFMRIIDIPYSFCVVDGYLNILEFPNPIKKEFIAAIAINDKKIGEKLTQVFEDFWKLGKNSEALNFLSMLKST